MFVPGNYRLAKQFGTKIGFYRSIRATLLAQTFLTIFTIMKLRYFLSFLLIGVVVAACAQTKSQKKAKAKKVIVKSDIKLLEATSQRMLPGIPGAQPTTEFRFIIIWQNANWPETFFWRGENGWMTCKMDKAHKSKASKDYKMEFVANDQVHKGDTLSLKPIRGGKFPIPDEIPETAKNTLYYKVAGSKWLAFPVTTITRKPDVAMP